MEQWGTPGNEALGRTIMKKTVRNAAIKGIKTAVLSLALAGL